jgi:hypothetical protein
MQYKILNVELNAIYLLRTFFIFPYSLCTMGTGSFPGVKRPGRGADHPPPSTYVPRSWKGRAIPLLTLWAFVACYRENFTFYL